MGTHRQPFVVLGIAVQLMQATIELAILVAQHVELVTRQRRRRAVFARHHQGQRKVRELLQEIRMPAQPRRHFMRAELFGAVIEIHGHNHSPSKTKAVGPPM